jgi:hypothetical protein
MAFQNSIARILGVAVLIAAAIGVIGLPTALAPAHAQTDSVKTWAIPPTTIGATSVDLCKLPGGPPCSPANPTVRLCFSKAGNTSGSVSSITMCDKEAVPVCTWNAVPIAANTVYDPMTPIFPPNTVCELWPGGITFTAGTAGAIAFEARGTYVGQ